MFSHSLGKATSKSSFNQLNFCNVEKRENSMSERLII